MKMSEKTKTTIGLILTVIAIIISFTVPEVRSIFGLDNDELTTDIQDQNQTLKNGEKEDIYSNYVKNDAKSESQKENLESKNEQEPDNVVVMNPQRRSMVKVNIYDEETGKRDFKFENYLKEIFESLEFKDLDIEGSKSVEITPNKSVPNQVRATIEISISLNEKSLIFPMFYGRGATEKEAINHALIMNKESIINKIKLLK